MPCDGKNPNCERRRELLAQLKCLVTSMDKKKPCEWDEPPCPPPVLCPVPPSCCDIPCCSPVKRCKSFDFRGSVMHRCECIKRNGLQDRCMLWDCMGRPECMTKLYPVCGPGRAALLKLTDLGDAEVALRKFYCADQAREAALAAYCRLSCDRAAQSNQCDRNVRPACCDNGQQDQSCHYRKEQVPCPSPCCQNDVPKACNGSEESCKALVRVAPPGCPPCVTCCPPPPCCIPCPPCGVYDSCVPCPPPCPPPCLPCVPCYPPPCCPAC